MTQVFTNQISVDDWKRKIQASDDEWLLRQHYGLSLLLDMIECQMDDLYAKLKDEKGNIPDETFRDMLYPLENDQMEMDIQFVDIEDELERRGIDIMLDIDSR
jgi:hypothetical protein